MAKRFLKAALFIYILALVYLIFQGDIVGACALVFGFLQYQEEIFGRLEEKSEENE